MSKRRTERGRSPGADGKINAGESNGDSLFVYGSLMDPATRARMLGGSRSAIRARLPGYRRAHMRYFYIVRDPGATTDGMLLAGLSERDFRILDEYEDVPRLYTRERTQVFTHGGEAKDTWVYLPTGWARSGTS